MKKLTILNIFFSLSFISNVFSQELIKNYNYGTVYLKNNDGKSGYIKLLYPFGFTNTLLKTSEKKTIIKWEDINRIEIDNVKIYPKIIRYGGYHVKGYFYTDIYIFYHRKRFGKNNISLKYFEILNNDSLQID